MLSVLLRETLFDDFGKYSHTGINANKIGFLEEMFTQSEPLQTHNQPITRLDSSSFGLYPFGSPYYIQILILFHTGMKISGVCGLTRDNVDFDKKIIR